MMQNNNITEIDVGELVDCLENLHGRLVSDYNDGTGFEQIEEDRHSVLTALEVIEANTFSHSNKTKTICIKMDEELLRNFKIKVAQSGKTLQDYMFNLINNDINPVTPEQILESVQDAKSCLKEVIDSLEQYEEKISEQIENPSNNFSNSLTL